MALSTYLLQPHCILLSYIQEALGNHSIKSEQIVKEWRKVANFPSKNINTVFTLSFPAREHSPQQDLLIRWCSYLHSGMQSLYLGDNLVFTLTARCLITSCHQKILIAALAKANSPKTGPLSSFNMFIICQLSQGKPQEPQLCPSIVIASGLHAVGKINRHIISSQGSWGLACCVCGG